VGYVVSLLLLLFALFALLLQAQLNISFAGEEVTVQLRLENAGYLPVTWLEIEEEVPARLAGEQRSLSHALRTSRAYAGDLRG